MYIEKTESYELHQPDDWYSGVIVGVEESQYGENEPSFKFMIELDGEDRDTWLFTSQKYSDFPSKLWKLAEALLGEAPPEGVDTDAFINKRIDVMFKHQDDDGKTREKVDRFRATRAKTDDALEAPF